MIKATDSSNAPPGSDPTLEALIPKRSTHRNIVLAGAAVALLVAVWLSPSVLRPSVVAESGAATWSALAPHHQVLTVIRLDPDGRPFVDVEAVEDVPGGVVVGAWILPEADYGLGDGLDPNDYDSGLDFVAAAFAARNLETTTQLPQRLRPDGPVQLVTLWDITNCAALGGDEGPTVTLRSPFGTTVHEELLDGFASPGFDLPMLVETGICPAS